MLPLIKSPTYSRKCKGHRQVWECVPRAHDSVVLTRKEHLAAAQCSKGNVVAYFTEGMGGHLSISQGKLAKREPLSEQIQILVCLAPKFQFLPHPDKRPITSSTNVILRCRASTIGT